VSSQVSKAVFPVAGLGTRFLPATKANPKEMLPVVDKPLVQYAAEEAEAAGCDSLVFVTGRTKRSIADHFDKAYELENELKSKNKQDRLDILKNIVLEGVSCIYIRQAEALGLGHAVLCSEPVVGNEPFAVLLADDLLRNDDDGVLSQMQRLYAEHQCCILGVERVPMEDTASYGVVDIEPFGDRLGKVKSIVEKPDPEEAPSNLAVVGRYILTPRIFEMLKKIGKGAGGEIQLTDAIAELLKYETVLAYEFVGKRYDCGSKLGYLQANVEYALDHPEVGDAFSAYLKELKLA